MDYKVRPKFITGSQIIHGLCITCEILADNLLITTLNKHQKNRRFFA